MSSSTKSDGIAVSAEQNGLRPLFRQLHQITQPLSVLQGTLELALIQAGNADDYRRAVVKALHEVTRVTECFDELRRQIGLFGQRETENRESGVHRV